MTVLTRLHDTDVLSRAARAAPTRAPGDRLLRAHARRMRQVLEDDHDRRTVLTRHLEDLSPTDERLLRRLLGAELPDRC
ncbi:hypothetical protein LN042_28755 [Kitasatospora sp. RB6PN24]|nr:hypothetical protein [Kitasatospora humi]